MRNKYSNKRIIVTAVSVILLYAVVGVVLFYLNNTITNISFGSFSVPFAYFAAVILFVILTIISIVSVISAGTSEKDREGRMNRVVVDALSEDFSCVMYVPLEKGNKQEKVYTYRATEQFASCVKGYSKARSFSEMLAMICKGIVASDDVEHFMESTSRSMIIEKIRKMPSYCINFKAIYNGTEVFSRLQFSPVKNSRGELTAFVLGIRNIDETVREKITMQNSLRDALARASAASGAKMKFLNEMSRDMRTPLNAIVGYARLAGEHINEKEKVADYIEKLCQSSENLVSSVNGIIDMSRIEAGKVGTDETNVNLSKLVDKVIDTVKIPSLKKYQKITKNIDITNKDVICDRMKLEQILGHILGNAVRFTPNEGHITFSVNERSVSDTGYAAYEFRIKDSGIGMNDEFIKSVFDPYFKADEKNQDGSGLGLTITKAFVEMLGGTIEVVSRENVGTEFIVLLEMKIYEAVKKHTVSRPDFSASEAENPQEQDITERLKGKKILLVEDNELNAEIAKELLEESGFIVTVAEDGLIAVNTIFKATPGEYDIVLMDIQMPVVDGFTATKRIREMDNGMQNIPIIAMTASALATDRAAALEAGMNEHIAKPINISVLIEILADFI